MSYATTNPYTNEVIKTFPDATDAEVDAALDRAQAAFPAWRDTPIAERAAIFRKAAQLALERKDELARLATLEMGKSINESLMEVTGMAAPMLNWFADRAPEALRPTIRHQSDTGGESIMTYEPQGIVFSIEPWNVPYYQAIRGFGPAAIAGNVVILKHASIVPQCAQAIVDVLHDAGLPDGVWQNLYATHAQADRIIADPRVRAVTLTGSWQAGSHVAEQAGKALRKTVLELGGSDAFVVLADADLEAAVGAAAAGRCFTMGQICASPKRMIVDQSLYQAFLEGLKTSMGNLHPGDPMDPTTTLAPLSSQAQADTVKDQIRRAVAAGATAIPVGEPVPSTGAFIQPTILTNVTPDNPIFREEIFGLVPIVFSVPDEDAAVSLANDSPFGLTGMVWSRDPEHALAIARRMDTGQVAINGPLPAVSVDVPFGGVKSSGYGREMGPEGVREFVNIKPIGLPAGVHAEITDEGIRLMTAVQV